MFLVGLKQGHGPRASSTRTPLCLAGAPTPRFWPRRRPRVVKPTLVEGLEDRALFKCAPASRTPACSPPDGRALLWGQDDCGQLGSSYMVSISRRARPFAFRV